MEKEKRKKAFSFLRRYPFYKQSFVTLVVCGYVIGHGCALGFPAILFNERQKPEEKETFKLEMSSIAQGTIIAMILGCIFSNSIKDRFGSKMALYAVALASLGGWLIIIGNINFEMRFIGRILLSLSYGLHLPLRSAIIKEYSRKKRRTFLAMISLAQTFGIYFVHLLGSFFSWQTTSIMCLFFPFMSLFMTWFLPKSSITLVGKKNHSHKEEIRNSENKENNSVNEKKENVKKTKKKRITSGGKSNPRQSINRNKQNNNTKKQKPTTEVKKGDENKPRAIADKMSDKNAENIWRRVRQTIQRAVEKFNKLILLIIHGYAMADFATGSTILEYINNVTSMFQEIPSWKIISNVQIVVSNIAAVYVLNTFPCCCSSPFKIIKYLLRPSSRAHVNLKGIIIDGIRLFPAP